MDEKNSGFISQIRKYSLQELLIEFSMESSELFKINTKDDKMPCGTKFESFEFASGRIKRRQEVLVTAWGLVDIAYQAILNSNDYRSKKVKSKREIYEIVSLYTEYVEHIEGKQEFMKNEAMHDDFLIYLYGFFGEQTKFQLRHMMIENYNRESYIINNIAPIINDGIDVEGIVKKEIGLFSDEVTIILLYLWSLSTKTPFIVENDQFYNKDILKKQNVINVVNYYTADYWQIRENKLGRQVLYSKPIVKTDRNRYLCINSFLLYFLIEHSTYWIVRNYYQNMNKQDFINAFGVYFEEYFYEILCEYLDCGSYKRIEEGKTKKADWYINMDGYEILLEQKSALASLKAKQQESDINSTKQYALRNWMKAISQLQNTEYDYGNKKMIKIILVYEEYYKSEMLENIFSLSGSAIENDGYYWLVSISEFEMLLYSYKTDKKLFKEIMQDKIRMETENLHEGRDIRQIFERYGIKKNLHIEQEKYNYYSYISKKFKDEINSSTDNKYKS